MDPEQANLYFIACDEYSFDFDPFECPSEDFFLPFFNPKQFLPVWGFRWEIWKLGSYLFSKMQLGLKILSFDLQFETACSGCFLCFLGPWTKVHTFEFENRWRLDGLLLKLVKSNYLEIFWHLCLKRLSSTPFALILESLSKDWMKIIRSCYRIVRIWLKDYGMWQL